MRETENLTAAVSALRGRLEKRQRHLARWASREGTNAYRLFDRDIPGWHFAVDRYDRYAVIAEYPWKAGEPRHVARREELLSALSEVCGLQREDLVVKEHLRERPGQPRYERKPGEDLRAEVTEGPLRFEVNLAPYLDVGLFLDQRTVRRWVRERCSGRRVANLFCYTGSFTVAAAVGKASRTLSVDLSRTYLDWAHRNLTLNGVAGPKHELLQADVLESIQSVPAEPFDLVICDPPPASVSKRAKRFEVQRDHEKLLLSLQKWLAPGGALFFSCNLGGFQLSSAVLEALGGAELTPRSMPEDFRGRPPHRAWLLGAQWLATS